MYTVNKKRRYSWEDVRSHTVRCMASTETQKRVLEMYCSLHTRAHTRTHAQKENGLVSFPCFQMFAFTQIKFILKWLKWKRKWCMSLQHNINNHSWLQRTSNWLSVEQLQVGDRHFALLSASLSHQPVEIHAWNAAHRDHLETRADEPHIEIHRKANSSTWAAPGDGGMMMSHSPHRPAGKARCCWQRHSRTRLWLCGCHWSYAIHWTRPMLWSCRGPRTRWAGRPTLRQWVRRCWHPPTQMTGCCWRTMMGNYWEGEEDDDTERGSFHIFNSALRLRFNSFFI